MSVLVLVLISTSVERFSVSLMQDVFKLKTKKKVKPLIYNRFTLMAIACSQSIQIPKVLSPPGSGVSKEGQEL